MLVVLTAPLKAMTPSPHEEALKTAPPTYVYVFYYSNNNNSAKLSQTEYLLMSNFFFKRASLGRGRGRNRENPKQAPHLAQSQRQGLIHNLEIRPEPKSRVR